ncbi:MAG: excinuclease ABC subunit UvrC [Clostridiaceae bacterium]|nr:excinuclease ABC subunit UvrC [Clostridiaceae bacterium]
MRRRMKPTIKETLRNLPDSPGVYIMRDNDNKVIYVGKAKALKNRVRFYFRNSQDMDAKTAALVSNVKFLEYIVTHTEEEAFILENTLIKKYRPKYNIMLKDDKSYPLIRISVQEDYPRIDVVRKIQKDGARYFGTYVSAGAVRESLDLLRRLFPIRTCKRNISPGKKQRPCLYFHIGLCSAPCSGNISKQDYDVLVQNICAFLEGRQDEVVRKLEEEMRRYADELKFEKAAAIRDRLKSVNEILKKQVVYSTKAEERDVIGLFFDDWNCAASVLSIRSGRLIGKRSFVLEGMGASTRGSVMDSFVLQYYDANPEIPREIALQYQPESAELLAEILSKKRGGKVTILVPKRGVKAELVNMAEQNAREELELYKKMVLAGNARSQEALVRLKTALGLPRVPSVIEAYDVSNTGDTEIVASMVVFREGRAERSLYRRFKMKAITSQNDYASMQETLLRRFGRYLGGSDDETFGTLPDLLLVDGGAAHVNAAREVLADLEIEVPVWGMAKDDRHRSHRLVDGQTDIDLRSDRGMLRLIASIQNEAHRYAIEYNRYLRRKRHQQSALDQIPGIGEVKKKALLRAFGSVKRIREASIEDISAVKGIGPKLAAVIKERLR